MTVADPNSQLQTPVQSFDRSTGKASGIYNACMTIHDPKVAYTDPYSTFDRLWCTLAESLTNISTYVIWTCTAAAIILIIKLVIPRCFSPLPTAHDSYVPGS